MKKIHVYQYINQLLHRFGLDFRRYPLRHRCYLIRYPEENRVHHCFDVGANTGQFAGDFLLAGYKGFVFSFKPVQDTFGILSKRA